MINNQSIALIIPFFNEEMHISEVISSVPTYVDKVILVNDGSYDDCLQIAISTIIELKCEYLQITKNELDSIQTNIYEIDNLNKVRFIIINHLDNLGKGAGIKSGYKLSLLLQMDCIATMDGDGQMNPEELLDICMPIVSGKADYSKGNRLAHPQGQIIIPFVRRMGIYILSFLTRLCSGYEDLKDTQSGFTAISFHTLKKLNINDIYDKYGYVNDVIIRISFHEGKIQEVPITPIYSSDRKSKMNILAVIPKISLMMFKLFLLKRKHKRVGEEML